MIKFKNFHIFRSKSYYFYHCSYYELSSEQNNVNRCNHDISL